MLTHPALRFAYSLPVVMFGWVLFRAPTLTTAVDIWANMLTPGANAMWLPQPLRAELTRYALSALAVGALIFVAPRGESIGSRLTSGDTPSQHGALELSYTCIALLACALLMLTGSFSPFLYFSF